MGGSGQERGGHGLEFSPGASYRRDIGDGLKIEDGKMAAYRARVKVSFKYMGKEA